LRCSDARIVQAPSGRRATFADKSTDGGSLMRRILWLVLVVVPLGACASANRIDRGADRHQARALQLDEQGHTRAATKERQAANKQSSKANTRRAFEDALPVVFD
jgi:hypothetical protein